MRFITAICLLLTTGVISLNAQSNSVFIGANGGANLSKFKFTEGLADLYPETKPVFGINAGVVAGIEIEQFTISAGLNYIQKGSDYQTENFDDEFGTGYFTGSEKLHYISVPLLVGYREYLSPRFAVSIAIGPSLNMGLGGKLDEVTEYFGTDDTETNHYTVAFGKGVNDDYRGMQIGFQVSPGLVFAMNNNNKLTFNVTWDSGLNDMYNQRYKDANSFFDFNSGDQFARSTVFSLGYEHHFNFGDRY